MTPYMLIGSFLVLCIVLIAWKQQRNSPKPQDSVLKQRAIFTPNEQLAFARLKEVLPDYIVLAHVSYDALLTTKFGRTRHKYRNLVADFVILDQLYQVIAIVGLNDPLILKRPQQASFRDALLSMAGYRVIRYEDVPEYYQLRRDFLSKQEQPGKELEYMAVNDLKKYHLYSDLGRRKVKAVN
jgi:very-short-patch-repair endonuclease